MPVVNNKFVTAAVVEGGIDIVTITNSGNNYTNGALQNIITIDGDGTSAVLKANVTGGHVVDVIIQNRGSQYTYADLTFTDVMKAKLISLSSETVVQFSMNCLIF